MDWELTQAHGLASRFIAAEWAVLASFEGARFFRAREGRSALGAVVFALFALSELFSVGHPIFSTGLLSPGSWATRILAVESELWVRRLIEPALVVFFALTFLNVVSFHGAAFYLSVFSTLLLLLLWIFEAWSLQPGVAAAFNAALPAIEIHYALCQGVLLFAIAAALCSLSQRSQRSVARTFALAAMVLFAGFYGVMKMAAHSPEPAVHVAAHYYSWFPENWNAHHAGEHFSPPVLPELGRYDQNDPDVFQRHLEWMNEAGIDLILFDLWTRNPAVRKRVDKETDALEGLATKFAVQYESLELREVDSPESPIGGGNDVFISPQRSERLAADWLWIAERYMSKSSYFSIDGRPVLFMYASRHLVGPIREAIDMARKRVRDKTGLDLFVVGDEVYFHVVDYSPKKGIFLRNRYEPNWPRLTAFDALTCYNSYDSSLREHAGSTGAARFFEDTSELYRHYQAYAATAGIDFFPGVLPGYNDRGVRPKENHFVLPRTILPERRDFFEEGLQRVVEPFRSRSRTFLFAVTSWNEWNEGSQIEPAAVSAETAEDDSGEKLFTTDEIYYGYGRRYLDALRRFRASLAAK